jgi:hypothetical protein
MLTLAVGCQNSSRVSDTSWDNYNLNGRVKSVELTEYNVIIDLEKEGDEDLDPSKVNVDEFGKDGMIQRTTIYGAQGDETDKTEYNFSEDEKLMSEIHENFMDDGYAIMEYKYTEEDLLEAVIGYDNSGKQILRMCFEYDSNGVEKRRLSYRENNELVYTIEFVEFNQAGQVTMQINQDVNDKYKTVTTNKYDDRGNLVKVVNLDENGKVLHEYEKQYDKHNNVIAVVSTWNGIQNYSKRYEYTYDNKNNWIKKISYNSDIKYTVEMRNIDYY